MPVKGPVPVVRNLLIIQLTRRVGSWPERETCFFFFKKYGFSLIPFFSYFFS
jgi:hypothetical protein